MGMGAALIYCRVSTKGQEDGLSLESQQVSCVTHAESLGYTVENITLEVYTGSELWDRPMLARDRADIAAGRYAALVAHAIDRLSRNPLHLMLIAEECARVGCNLIFVSETLEDTPEGHLIAYVKGYAAQIEREKIRERSLRNKYQRVLNGKVPNAGCELYGYIRDRDAGVRLIVEAEAEIVREIFHLIANAGMNCHTVADLLNERGVPPPGAQRAANLDPTRVVMWKHSAVVRIIHNPAYKGEGIAWKWRAVRTRNGKDGLELRPLDEQVHLPAGTVPAIVPSDLWEYAQGKLKRPNGDYRRSAQKPTLLRGLMTCTICGHRLLPGWRHHNFKTKGPERTYIYRCPSYSYEGHCGARTVPRWEVEDWVWAKVCEVLRRPGLIAQELERRQAEGPDLTLEKDLETARRNAQKCQTAQEKLLKQFTNASDDSFPWELVQKEVARLEGDKKRWQATVRELQGRIADQSSAADQLEHVQEYCARVAANLDTFTFEEKRLALETLHIHVVAEGRDWHLTGAIPMDMNDHYDPNGSPNGSTPTGGATPRPVTNGSGYDVSAQVSEASLRHLGQGSADVRWNRATSGDVQPPMRP
jgi:site-specific DNA recombinase